MCYGWWQPARQERNSPRVEIPARGRKKYLRQLDPYVRKQVNRDHLVSISAGGISVPGEAWQFTYNSISLTDPFASAAHGSTALLATAQQTPIISGGPGPSSFTYDTHAELTQYTTPMGGSLSWTYQNFTYNGNIQMNELATRGMNDSAASLTNTWTLSHGSGDNTRTYHALTYIIDTGASSQKIYGSGVRPREAPS